MKQPNLPAPFYLKGFVDGDPFHVPCANPDEAEACRLWLVTRNKCRNGKCPQREIATTCLKVDSKPPKAGSMPFPALVRWVEGVAYQEGKPYREVQAAA